MRTEAALIALSCAFLLGYAVGVTAPFARWWIGGAGLVGLVVACWVYVSAPPSSGGTFREW